jgi:hypothetical protein
MINDEGLVHLQQLKELRVLGLSNTNVSPSGIVHLIPLTRLSQISVAAREDSSSRHIDLLDHIMNSYWDELSFVTDDELRTMLLRFAAAMPKTQHYSLQGRPVDAANPETWIDVLTGLLAPIREFCAAIPGCKLR